MQPRRPLARRRLPAVMALVAVAFLGSLSAAASGRPLPRDSGPIFRLRAASAAPELAVSFEEAALTVSAATPGGDVVVFGLARVPRGVYSEVVRRSDVVLADALGEARYEMPDGEEVPFKSVWAAVDLATGHYGVAAPGAFPLQELGFPGEGFEVGAPGLVDRLRQRFTWVDELVVRPEVGAWRLHGADGAPEDEDGEANGSLVTGIERLEPLTPAGPGPPQGFAAGDVLVIVNPRDLRFYATRLLGPPP